MFTNVYIRYMEIVKLYSTAMQSLYAVVSEVLSNNIVRSLLEWQHSTTSTLVGNSEAQNFETANCITLHV